jgi:hypothetical protein
MLEEDQKEWHGLVRGKKNMADRRETTQNKPARERMRLMGWMDGWRQAPRPDRRLARKDAPQHGETKALRLPALSVCDRSGYAW